VIRGISTLAIRARENLEKQGVSVVGYSVLGGAAAATAANIPKEVSRGDIPFAAAQECLGIG